MGMGLSICRSIIEAHDGRLCVAPNRPQAAIFQFSLGPDPDPIQGGPMAIVPERLRGRISL
jgi:K+-sensing histidine kinase KdpD